MPIKFSKEMSTRLFKYVKTIDIKFNGMFSGCVAVVPNDSMHSGGNDPPFTGK